MPDNIRDEIISLSDRDHVLLRPGMYIGGTKSIQSTEFFLEDNKFVYGNKTYIPGLIKIIFEPIDNSLDVAIKSNFKYGNKINVEVTNTKVIVSDNGYGISQEVDKETNVPSPILAVGTAKAGSNFDENVEREHLGTYGYGVYLTNVFSKKFSCITRDGNSEFIVDFVDNNSSYTYSQTKKKCKCGTIIEFEPDLERFETDTIDDIHKNIIKQRLFILAVSYPEVQFTFNGEKINFKNYKSFASMFGDTYEITTFDNGFIAYYPTMSDEFLHYTIVNGQHVSKGGTHVNYINARVVNYLRDRLVKKYKDISPADIRNKLMLVAIMRKFPKATYTSQIKEELTNSSAHLTKYFENVDFDKFKLQIYKNPIISELITEMYRIKEEFQKQKDTQKIGKKPGKIKSDKYREPVGNKDYLLIVEGDSALGSIIKELGRKNKGYFSIRGKMLNVLEEKISRISENVEIDSIIKILGINPQHYVLNNAGNYYEMQDIANNISYIVHDNDLFKVSKDRWIEMSRLDREKYPLTKINRSDIDVIKYYCQPRVNQPFECSYKYIVFATDQDLDGCFTGDTKIKSPDGNTYTFEDLVRFKEPFIYTKNNEGQIIPALGYSPKITKKVNNLVQLFFNDYSIKCTPDHLIQLEDGTYKKAIDISIEDYLSSVYFANGRLVTDTKSKRITKKKFLHYDTPVPVYDMEVLEYHNYLVETDDTHKNGIFVHNCHIRTLLLTMFIMLLLPLVKANKIKYLNTPIVALKKNTKIVKYFLSLDDYYNYTIANPNAKGEWKYYKGLGSWADGELKQIIDSEGMEKFLTTFEYDENSYNSLYNWMSSKTSDYRKIMVKAVQGDVSEA